MSYKDNINQFYEQFISHHTPDDPGIVAWTCKEAQHSRFKILHGIGITNADTVLDLGCGVGGYVDYLKSISFPLENYRGVDINEKYVSMAQQAHPGVTFSCGEIFDVTEEVDYIIGSGVFTVHMPLQDVLLSVATAYHKARKGVAFNFLTKDFLEMRGVNSYVPTLFHEVACKYVNPGKSELKTDYYDNEDFTIYLYK